MNTSYNYADFIDLDTETKLNRKSSENTQISYNIEDSKMIDKDASLIADDGTLDSATE